MAYRRRSRRNNKKNRQNDEILIVAAAIGIGSAYIFGSHFEQFLNAAILYTVGAGVVLLLILIWFVSRTIKNRAQRQSAVNHKNTEAMDWKQFEFFSIDILKARGYKLINHSSNPGDHGADVVMKLKGRKVSIQVKHHGDVELKTDNSAVQEAVAAKAIYGCVDSMVITNTHYTAGAILLGVANGTQMVDRETLGKWIIEAQH